MLRYQKSVGIGVITPVNTRGACTITQPRHHAGGCADRVLWSPAAVPLQVPQHVEHRSLSHAAAHVDVGRVAPGSDPAGVNGDGERVAAAAVDHGGPALRRAVTDPLAGDLDRDEPV